MSRVTYANTPATVAQETLRQTHGVRVVTVGEEGSGVDALTPGVYGFTYSPGLHNAPLFATRRYRSYETHKLASGQIFLIGFATPDVAHQLVTAQGEITVVVQPEPDELATVISPVPYLRIRFHKQYSAPNQHGFTVTVTPA